MVSNNDDEDDNKRDNPFDNHKNKEFERMIRDIEQMMRESLRDVAKKNMKPGNSFVHGFNINIGPDGDAKVREFGNYPRKRYRRKKQPKEKKPPVDVLENREDVSVTCVIPGVQKEDIDLKVVDNTLDIKLNIPQYNYHKKIDLPCEVKPKKTKATYVNGILDVSIEKKNKNKKDPGHQVNIE